MKLAIFDIDGTLINAQSTERRFFMHLVKRRQIGFRQLASFLNNLYPAWRQHRKHALKKNKAYLNGLNVATVAALAEQWADTLPQDAWCAPVVDQLKKHLSRGDRVLLLSGTLAVLADVLARRLHAHDSQGTLVALDGDLYCGSRLICHPFGKEKQRLVQELAQEMGIDPQDVVAYGDSHHDQELLNWVGRPVATNPNKRLAALARQNSWTLISG